MHKQLAASIMVLYSVKNKTFGMKPGSKNQQTNSTRKNLYCLLCASRLSSSPFLL